MTLKNHLKYGSNNCHGMALEGLFGIVNNASPDPDWRGWELKAKLISSKELTSSELEKIQTELSSDFKSPIKIEYKYDASLIGGLVIQVGSIMVDASIKTKLKQLEKNMIGS